MTNPWVTVWRSEPTSLPPLPVRDEGAQPRRSLEPVLDFEIGLFRAGKLSPSERPVLIEKLRVCPRPDNLTIIKEILALEDLDSQAATMALFARAYLVAAFCDVAQEGDLLWSLEFAKQAQKERLASLLELMGRTDSATWGPVAKSDDLRALALDAAVDSGRRAHALLELLARGHADVPGVVDGALADARPGSEWGNAILHAAERVEFTAESQRARVLQGLRRHAEALKDLPGDEQRHALWAALRRYSSMVPVKGVGFFLPFLEHPDIETRQCALQSVANVFSREAPLESADVAALRAGAGNILSAALSAPRAPEQIALALAAFCAAAALDHEDLGNMARALYAMKSGFAVRRALRKLGELTDAREASGGPGAGRLRAAMEILRADS